MRQLGKLSVPPRILSDTPFVRAFDATTTFKHGPPPHQPLPRGRRDRLRRVPARPCAGRDRPPRRVLTATAPARLRRDRPYDVPLASDGRSHGRGGRAAGAGLADRPRGGPARRLPPAGPVRQGVPAPPRGVAVVVPQPPPDGRQQPAANSRRRLSHSANRAVGAM